MNTITPNKLQKGDTIGLLSASGALSEAHLATLKNAKNYFEERGFNVIISSNSYDKKFDYLAGCDTQRIKAFNSFFEDKNIKAIIATRGGYGALRIADKINYNLIAQNPKIFVGYSDITVFLWNIYTRTGLAGFHGAMACPDFGQNIDGKTEQSFWDMISGKTNEINFNPTFLFNSVSIPIEGVLMPANLSTLVSMCGRNFYPNKEIILLIEDINEPVYKIDRMMTQLLTDEKFKKNVKAIVLGYFDGLDNEKEFVRFWQNFALEYQIPIINGLPFGHRKTNITLPVGVNAKLDLSKNKILF